MQFDLGFNDVVSVSCDNKNDKLLIRQATSSKIVVVYFKPHYSLAFEDDPKA